MAAAAEEERLKSPARAEVSRNPHRPTSAIDGHFQPIPACAPRQYWIHIFAIAAMIAARDSNNSSAQCYITAAQFPALTSRSQARVRPCPAPEWRVHALA